MKINTKLPRVARLGEFTESSFGIKNENLNVLFDILRNKMYSDKMLAIIREYSVNGLDAHIDSGIPNKPIRIHLPSTFEPSFSIRDFGEGLSESEVREIYCMYGSSTKRQSNEVTGQLGLGSKSAFAYTDSFVISSYNKGIKKTYNAYIDETNIGKISLINSQDSEEPDGIQIKIPIKTQDVNDFIKKAKQVFYYFKIKPIIDNYKDFYKDNDEKKEVLSGKDWSIYKRVVTRTFYYSRDRNSDNEKNRPLAIMGNIAYPISADSITNLHPVAKSILDNRIEISFEIGDLEISASRESLEYGHTTCKNIQKKCLEISKEIIKESEEKLQKCKVLWDAKIFCKGLWSCLPGFKETILNNNFLKWKGNVVDNNSFNFGTLKSSLKKDGFNEKEVDRLQLYNVKINHNGNISKSEVYSFTADEDLKVCIRDTGIDKWIIRSKQLLNQNSYKNLLVFTKVDGSISHKMSIGILKLLGMWSDDLEESEKNWKYLSEVKIKKPKADPNKPKITNTKNSAKAFKLKDSLQLSRYETVYSNYWNTTQVDRTSPGIFVEISSFKLSINDGLERPVFLNNILSDLENLNLKIKLPEVKDVYGIKSKYVSKFKENKWERIEDVLESRLKKYLQDNDMLDHSTNRQVLDSHGNLSYHKYLNRIEEFNNKECLIVKYLKRINALNKKINKEKSKEASRIKEILLRINRGLNVPKNDPEVKTKILQKMEQQVIEKYPMLSYIGYWKSIPTSSDISNIINYVNLIEVNSNEQ